MVITDDSTYVRPSTSGRPARHGSELFPRLIRPATFRLMWSAVALLVLVVVVLAGWYVSLTGS